MYWMDYDICWGKIKYMLTKIYAEGNGGGEAKSRSDSKLSESLGTTSGHSSDLPRSKHKCSSGLAWTSCLPHHSYIYRRPSSLNMPLTAPCWPSMASYPPAPQVPRHCAVCQHYYISHSLECFVVGFITHLYSWGSWVRGDFITGPEMYHQ